VTQLSKSQASTTSFPKLKLVVVYLYTVTNWGNVEGLLTMPSASLMVCVYRR
jgi:hypothetical protein